MTLWLVFTPGGVRHAQKPHAHDDYPWTAYCGREPRVTGRGLLGEPIRLCNLLAPINRHRAVPCRQCLAEIERRIRVSQAIVDEMREDLR